MTSENGWNVETLREHILERIDTLEEHIDQRLADFRRHADDRFEGQSKAAQRAAELAEKAAAIATAHDLRLEALQQRMDRHEGSATGLKSGWTTTVSAVVATGIVVTIVFSVVELLVAR